MHFIIFPQDFNDFISLTNGIKDLFPNFKALVAQIMQCGQNLRIQNCQELFATFDEKFQSFEKCILKFGHLIRLVISNLSRVSVLGSLQIERKVIGEKFSVQIDAHHWRA